MIVTKQKVKKLIDLWPTQKDFADILGIDDATVSKAVGNKYETPRAFIEKFLLYTKWSFDDAFEIEEDDK